jgi:hypothetical protein
LIEVNVQHQQLSANNGGGPGVSEKSLMKKSGNDKVPPLQETPADFLFNTIFLN